ARRANGTLAIVGSSACLAHRARWARVTAAVDVGLALVEHVIAARRGSAQVGDAVAAHAVRISAARLLGVALRTSGATAVDIGLVTVLDGVDARRAGTHRVDARERDAIGAHEAFLCLLAGRTRAAAVDVGLGAVLQLVVADGRLTGGIRSADQRQAVSV